MTALLKVESQYVNQFQELIAQLPKNAVNVTPIKNSLSKEVEKRIEHYKHGEMETTPFSEGLNSIREGLFNRL